jgi:phage/plasmid primase-like uncharacterized protein
MKASELSHRLGLNAEAVCRYYLPNGRKAGRYWQVGNVQNEKGQSMFVRLGGPGVAGKWQDASTDQHGDLLDMIQLSRDLPDLLSAMVEAAHFLRLSPAPPPQNYNSNRKGKKSSNTDIAKRLYADARPLAGTLGETYLNKRGVTLREGLGALRFHPRAWFDANTYRPAIIVGVHNNAGKLMGINRMFLDKTANLIERRALGELNGNAARTGPINAHHLLVGEGLESTLSFTVTHPGQALAATLSAAHMAAFNIPAVVRYLTIAADNDAAGRNAAKKLEARAFAQGVAARVILPRLGDFNNDLVAQNHDF